MTIPAHIFEKIDEYRDLIIELQAALTARVALGPKNGGSGEHEKADYLKEKLKELTPDSLEEIKAPEERARDGYRPNLVARWQGNPGEPTVWVLSHMDIVPPGDLSLWHSDPYRIQVDGDRIIGRGVEDNQHGIISSYLALKAVKESGTPLKRSVGLVMVADEETSSRYGLAYILKNHGSLFKPDDLIIVPDGGNEEGTMVELAEKSLLWLKIAVQGRQCHASTPEKGKNSLYGAARMILALETLKEKFGYHDAFFSPPTSTFEPTKMEANVPNINTIPGKNVFYLDCRILPHYQVSEIIEVVKGIAAETAEDLDIAVDVEPVYREDAAEPTSVESPVAQALIRAVKTVTGRDAVPMGIGGGTVAAFFRKAGLPAAVWQTMQDTPHKPNEYCLISDIMSDIKILSLIYLDQ